eukprot:1161645-Pelagomonas_calceolata.AAC.20
MPHDAGGAGGQRAGGPGSHAELDAHSQSSRVHETAPASCRMMQEALEAGEQEGLVATLNAIIHLQI